MADFTHHTAVNLKAALMAATAGFEIFPAFVSWNDKTKRWDKQPAITGWQIYATSDPTKIRELWRQYPGAVPGINLRSAGLIILDPDRHGEPDGVAAWHQLVAQNPDCAVVHPVTATPGNGEHHAFKQPPGEKHLGNRTGSLPPGTDCRGSGGWIVAPGAMRPDGKLWQPAEGAPSLFDAFKADAIPPLPSSLLALIREPKAKANGHDVGIDDVVTKSPSPEPAQQPPPASSGMRGRAYAAKALRGIAADLGKKRQPGRNNALNDAAFRMGTMAVHGWIEKATVIKALSHAMHENGYVADKGKAAMYATFASGFDAGFKQPHAALPERAPADDDKVVGDLTKLSDIEYGRRRKETAEELGVTVGILDKVVRDRRKEDSIDGELPHWKVEPVKTAVDTAELLDIIVRIFGRHIVLPKHADTAIALWILHSWTFDANDISPFLAMKSPTKRCGKTSVLILLYWLAHKTELASNISPSAIFRYIEAERPTLLIDEAETFVNSGEETRGILNSGHTKTAAHVIRAVEAGGEFKAQRFSTWAPKALAHIKDLPDTIEDRSITILMQRKPKGARVERLLRKDAGEYADVRQLAARWAEDNIERLKGATPQLPRALNDRAADNWEPLLAVADLAGEDWARMARAAALALSGEDAISDEDLGIQLLHDIDSAFETLHEDALSTKELIAHLVDDEEKPWAAFGKAGKSITDRHVAKLLKPFEIYPGSVRRGELTPKGYKKTQFNEALERYPRPKKPVTGSADTIFAQDTPSGAPQRHNPTAAGTSGVFSSATKDHCGGYENGKKPNNDGHCGVVADRKPESAREDDSGTSPERLVCSQCGADDNTADQPLTDHGGGLVLHKICAEVWFREHPDSTDGWSEEQPEEQSE